MTGPDTSVLEERTREIEQYSRQLVQAETQQTSAVARITEIEADLTERGYDPSTDLDEQLATQETELVKLTTSIGGLLDDVAARLAPEEASK